MTMMFLSSVFPPAQRGRAMGLFGMGQTAGPVLGTVLGGYLTEYLSWRMVFLLNVVPASCVSCWCCSCCPTCARPSNRPSTWRAY